MTRKEDAYTFQLLQIRQNIDTRFHVNKGFSIILSTCSQANENAANYEGHKGFWENHNPGC